MCVCLGLRLSKDLPIPFLPSYISAKTNDRTGKRLFVPCQPVLVCVSACVLLLFFFLLCVCVSWLFFFLFLLPFRPIKDSSQSIIEASKKDPHVFKWKGARARAFSDPTDFLSFSFSFNWLERRNFHLQSCHFSFFFFSELRARHSSHLAIWHVLIIIHRL